jgi:hypothetical protein
VEEPVQVASLKPSQRPDGSIGTTPTTRSIDENHGYYAAVPQPCNHARPMEDRKYAPPPPPRPQTVPSIGESKEDIDKARATTAKPAWPDVRDEALRIAEEHLEVLRQEANSSQVPASRGSPSAHKPKADPSWMELLGRQPNQMQAIEQTRNGSKWRHALPP